MSHPKQPGDAALNSDTLGALFNNIKATFDLEGCEADTGNWLRGRVEVFHGDGNSRFLPIRVSKAEYVAWHDLRFPPFPYCDAPVESVSDPVLEESMGRHKAGEDHRR